MWRVHRRLARLLAIGFLAAAAAAAAGCGSGDGEPGSPYSPLPTGSSAAPSTQPPATPSTAPTAEVRYRFDSGLSGDVYDEGRRLPLRARAEAGGELRAVPRGTGYAVRFPERCAAGPQAPGCPRAILESGPAGLLNPGTRPVLFGASVRITPAQEAVGANVLQKGFSTAGSQFKLQVDRGRASCVVADARDKRIHVAQAPQPVVDGEWHTLACERRGTRLAIVVDGAQRYEVAVPAELTIDNDEPLRIGGKSLGPGNDQFSGEIDDVYVVIE
ncbi:MAG TPA: LamG-like jellyroll fold domain-containing protein [Micromonosporaceae bacterium]|nr:LamG-like jellyroll fold domain-containing protein [Micromonosporaceae bacterium]